MIRKTNSPIEHSETGNASVSGALKNVLAESARFSKYAYTLIEELRGNVDTSSLLWKVASKIISDLELEDCVIYLLSDCGNFLEQRAACGPKLAGEETILAPIQIPIGKGIVGNVCVSGVPEIIRDTRTDSRYILDDISRLSELTVPIILSSGEVIGAIDSEHSLDNYFTKEHLHVFELTASIVSYKIEIIRLKEQLIKIKNSHQAE